jgi:hypothetical protein
VWISRSHPFPPGTADPDRCRVCYCSVSSAVRADEVIGIDLGTTNSCVAVMEGKVSCYVLPRTCSSMLFNSPELLT